MDLISMQDILMAGLGAARMKGTTHDVVLGDVGDVDQGEGVRVTLVPNYLLVEVNTSEDEGELWIPIVSLLELIGDLNRKVGS